MVRNEGVEVVGEFDGEKKNLVRVVEEESGEIVVQGMS